MVKPDAKHDYYADLELPPTADAEDVKRQFRQLGQLNLFNFVYSADELQPSSIIPIGTLVKRVKSLLSSRQSRRPMKFYVTSNSRQNMIRTEPSSID